MLVTKSCLQLPIIIIIILFIIIIGSQYDTSLALRPMCCDKIPKTDWSNARKNRIRSYSCITLHLTALKEAHHLHNTVH